MRKFARILILCVSLLMCFMTVGAENAHFTFTNVETNQPDLYITKTASSAVDGYSYPADTEFTFVLKWDQDGDGVLEFAENEMYYIYNSDGSLYTENGSEIFRTSSTGRFTLKAGQYAKFEWAGTVAYEITEISLGDTWIQIVPAGGAAASGVVDASGTIVYFENQYIPTDTGGGGPEPETTILEIRKDISWADGYEKPDLSDVQFTFSVKIDGKVYSNQRYDLYNASDTGLTNIIESGLTDSNGCFSMAGDQMAVFEEIETGVDYEISETGTDGWHAIGNTEYHGSTTSPLTYGYFANGTDMLAVKKVRSDGKVDSDDEFTFVIKDSDGNAMSGLSYYIYDANGNLVDENLHITDENGQFVLKAGQTALFIELTNGNTCAVSEIVPDDYTVDQETQSAVITDDNMKTLTFTNTQIYYSGFIIEKTVVNKDDVDDDFSFTLTDEGGNPVSGLPYEVYDSDDKLVDGDCETDEDGQFTLKNGQYAVFDHLPVGNTYTVKENVGNGYTVDKEEQSITIDRYENVKVKFENTKLFGLPNTGFDPTMMRMMLLIGGLLCIISLNALVFLKRRNGGNVQ